MILLREGISERLGINRTGSHQEEVLNLGIFGRGKDDEAKREELFNRLKKVQDPDLHRDIVSLGFVKELTFEQGRVYAKIELTTPACPAKEQLRQECLEALQGAPGVKFVEVEMTAQTASNVALQMGQGSLHPSIIGVRNIIAIASGKGGVGKSTTTVSLAYALQARGAKVGILDADVYGPSIPKMIQVGKPSHMLDDLVLPPEKDGIKIISSEMFTQPGQAQMLRGPMVGQIVKQMITNIAWGELDYLLIDYPPGTGDIQLTLSQVAPITGAVMVTTPQEVALLDVRRAVNMFHTLKVPVLGVLETMSYFLCDGCDKRHYIFLKGGGQRLADEVGVPLLGEIPLDPRLAQASDAGQSLIIGDPESVTAKAFMDASGLLVREQSKILSQIEGAMTHFRLEWK